MQRPRSKRELSIPLKGVSMDREKSSEEGDKVTRLKKQKRPLGRSTAYS